MPANTRLLLEAGVTAPEAGVFVPFAPAFAEKGFVWSTFQYDEAPPIAVSEAERVTVIVRDPEVGATSFHSSEV